FEWLSNLYGNTGLSAVTDSCQASDGNMPAFTIDPNNQPTSCATGGTPAPPLAVINLIDPDFQFPSNWRFNIAAYRVLFVGIVATAEFMYTRVNKQIQLRELNVYFDNPVTQKQGRLPVFRTHTKGPISASNTNVASP